MKVIFDIEQALMLRKHPVYTVTEHPVSGGILEHSQLTGVGAMTSRLLRGSG